MIEIETRMRIERPIEDVFDYMADPPTSRAGTRPSDP
jgi:hypothetical protein